MSVLLYWLGVKAYELAVRIAALWNEKAAEAVRGRRELLTKIEDAMCDESRPRVWMHCASLGEFEQGRPVLEALRAQHPGYAFVLTFFSPSGYQVRKGWDGADYVFYLPFDGAHRAWRLVAALRPTLAVWVKYEFWHFTLRTLKKAGVPTILIAAGLAEGAPAFHWWGGLHRRMLRIFSRVFVQDDGSAARLRHGGFDGVEVAGDPRYDRVMAAAASAQGSEKAERFAASGFTIVAGSTWPADEAVLAEAMQQLPAQTKLLLVPHEVDNVHLQRIEGMFGTGCVRWSREEGESVPRVLLVDSVGMLMSLYRYADVAYVGGGFGRAGVHNVLEPAAHGKPVMIGPVHHQFIEAGALLASNGAAVVKNAADFVAQVSRLMKDETARLTMGKSAAEVVQRGAGASEKIVEKIEAAGWLNTDG